MRLSEYLKKWETERATREKIHIATIEGNDDIFNIEMRFPANRYNVGQDRFDEITSFLTRRSGGVLFTETNLRDFRNGFLSLKIAFCNHGHSDEKLTKTMQVFMEEILPSLEK